jgi:hypothetical protein
MTTRTAAHARRRPSAGKAPRGLGLGRHALDLDRLGRLRLASSLGLVCPALGDRDQQSLALELLTSQ